TIGDLIFGGLMERFPTLRFGFFEGGVGWVPFLINRLDNNVSRGQADEPSAKLGKPPEQLPRFPREYFDRLYVAATSWEDYLGHAWRGSPASVPRGSRALPRVRH